MTFKTLEQRFLEQKNIYTQFPARTTVNSQPYVTITPDSPQSRGRIKDDNYALPVVSTQRDFERIKKFLASSNGKLFIAKQLLLQTGNTFADTKIYNPASPLLNTVPFLHIKRHISTSAVTQRIPGLLQVGTVTAFTPSPITQQYTGFRDFTRNFRNTITALGRNELRNAVGRIGGGLGNLLTTQSLGTSRPEFVVFGTANYNPRLTVSTTAAGRALNRRVEFKIRF